MTITNRLLCMVLIVMGLSFPGIVLADQGLWCEFPASKGVQYHGENLALIFDGRDAVWVHEATVYHFNKDKPIRGVVVADTGKRTTYKWQFRWTFANSVSEIIFVRLNFLKGSGSATLTAAAGNDSTNGSTAHGICKVTDIKP